MKLCSMWVIVANIFCSTGAFADCDSVLKNGVFSTSSLQTSREAQFVLAASLSKMQYSEAKRKTDAGAEVTIADFPLNGNYSQSEFNQWKEVVKSKIDVTDIDRYSYSVLLSSGDSGILAAWTTCIVGQGGLTIFVDRAGGNAYLKMRWEPYPGDPTRDPELVDDIVFVNAIPIGKSSYVHKYDNLGIKADRLVPLAVIDSSKAVLITVNTDVAGGVAYLPKPLIISSATLPEDKIWCIPLKGASDDAFNTGWDVSGGDILTCRHRFVEVLSKTLPINTLWRFRIECRGTQDPNRMIKGEINADNPPVGCRVPAGFKLYDDPSVE